MAGLGLLPSYVLDKMQWYEIDALLEGYDLCQRESWEKVRTMVTASLQSNSTKRLKAQKIFPLPWDKQTNSKKNNLIKKPSDESLNKFKEEAIQLLHNKKDEVKLHKLREYGK